MTFMDAEEIRRFLATLRSDDDFRASVRRELLTEELLNLPQTVAVLVDTAAQQRRDINALAQSVATYMQRTVSTVRDGFTALQSEVGGLRAEVGGLGSEVGGLRAEVGGLRAEMDAGFTAIKAKFDQVDADLRDIRGRLDP